MTLKRRIERLEHEVGIREVERAGSNLTEEEWRLFLGRMSDDEFSFFLCHGCSWRELEGKITRDVRQCTQDGLRVTIILEAVG